jgi:peptide deformylase
MADRPHTGDSTHQTVDPATLTIVRYPAAVLREPAAVVPPADADTHAVGRRMIELMQAAPGIGLAAPQVGLPWRMFVAHVPPPPPDDAADSDGDATPSGEPALSFTDGVTGAEVEMYTAEPDIFIDPIIRRFSRDLEPFEEGCLSLPNVSGVVRRPSAIEFEATTPSGERVVRRAVGLLARCWQHEIDHLDGVLIIDKFSPMDRRKMKREIAALVDDTRPA